MWSSISVSEHTHLWEQDRSLMALCGELKKTVSQLVVYSIHQTTLTLLYFSQQFSHTLAAPSNSPQNVTVDAGTPPTTSLEVNWDPVPQIDQNGIIILYEVRYDPLETFGGQITTGYKNTTSGSELMITLEDLQEYVEYNISVRAYTSVGAGPFSDGIVRRTEEDSKSNCNMYNTSNDTYMMLFYPTIFTHLQLLQTSPRTLLSTQVHHQPPLLK